MRPVKFRAWDKENEEMLYGTNFVIVNRSDGSLYAYVEWERGEQLECREVVLMQFIGLHDKNSKEIYEGDVVNCFTKYSGWQVCKVEYQESDIAFGFTMKDGSYLVMDDTEKEFEVIGNIHENSELLKEAK